MFAFKTQTEDLGLQEAIDTALNELKNHKPDTKEYSNIVDQLTKLYGMKRKPNTLSKDALLSFAGSILGVGMIMSFEKTHVMSQKALGFVKKP